MIVWPQSLDRSSTSKVEPDSFLSFNLLNFLAIAANSAGVQSFFAQANGSIVKRASRLTSLTWGLVEAFVEREIYRMVEEGSFWREKKQRLARTLIWTVTCFVTLVVKAVGVLSTNTPTMVVHPYDFMALIPRWKWTISAELCWELMEW